MKYNNKNEMRENAIQLYLKGNNYTQIAKIINCSRNYISDLIKDDYRIKNFRNKRIFKLYKKMNLSKISIPIPLEYWEKIGISKDPNIDESIEIIVNEKDKTILIKKVNS